MSQYTYLDYVPEMGEILWPDGFEAELEGKTPEEQLRCYAIAERCYGQASFHLQKWADRIKGGIVEPLTGVEGIEKLILRNGKLVGVVRWGKVCLPYSCVGESISSDNNGSGYKESETRSYLVCIPENPGRTVNPVPPFGAPECAIRVPVIPYEGSQEELLLPDAFAARLRGKPLAVQMDYYAIRQENPQWKQKWEDRWGDSGEYVLRELCLERYRLLRYHPELDALIVHNDILVGVRLKFFNEIADQWDSVCLYPYRGFLLDNQMTFVTKRFQYFRELICLCLPANQ